MFKSEINAPGWFILFLLVVSFFTGMAFWFGVSGGMGKRYYVDGLLQGKGITIFNNTGYWISISSNSIGVGELKNIGSPEELIDYSK
jgi:hypothetical protein